MQGFDTSMSSRSFREQLLFASIWSIFQRGSSSTAPANMNTHSPSTETGSPVVRPCVEDTSSGLNHSDLAPVQSASLLSYDGAHKEHNTHAASDSNSTPNTPNTTDPERDPFAGGVQGGIEYKTMVWWHAGMVMVAETISLGILSLPLALSTLGLVPGLVLLLGLGGLASYSGYIIGQFKAQHPSIHSWADAGEVLLGRYGREILGAGQLLFIIFVMGSHILTFSVTMSAITERGACSIVFSIVGTVLSILFTLPRTLKNLSYYSITSFVSIIGAVLITMIGVSITRPGGHIDIANDRWIPDIRLWPRPDVDFHEAFLAMSNMVFAYAGHVAFFSFICELKDPHDFPKALAFLQVSDISMYIVTAVVIYYYAGENVASPAIDSASSMIRKIAYGVAIPTIIIAGVVNGHVAVKYLYVRLLRNDKEDTMHQKSAKAIGLWVALSVALWLIAWVIAESIPVFSDLLGVTSALFASWFTFGLSGIFWFHMKFYEQGKWRLGWRKNHGFKWKTGVAFVASFILLVAGTLICVVGLYASGKSIALSSRTRKPFSCFGS